MLCYNLRRLPGQKVKLVNMLGAKYRSAQSRDGTCAISSSNDRAPISRLLKQSRDGAAPTHNDFYHSILMRLAVFILEVVTDWPI